MIDIPFNTKDAPLTWRFTSLDGKPTPYFTCKCGQSGPINNHGIDERGVVHPSMFHDIPGCGFHDHILLQGFKTP